MTNAGNRTVTVNLPAVFREWLNTTDLVKDPAGVAADAREMWLACTSGRHIRSGNTYYVRVRATATTLDVLKEYAGYCVDAYLDLPGGRLNAARKVIQRVDRAKRQLDAA